MSAPTGIFAALAPPGMTLDHADLTVPESAGLYAIYADASVWSELGLGDPPDGRPLYVGKAEDSLASRDLRTHFGTGRTGSSTVRRSFAALLRQHLALTAQPRNLAKPERPANFGLPPDQDEQLTRWMRSNLRIATWIHDGRAVPLRDLERQVLAQWLPPLNLIAVHTSWTAQVKAARRIMTDEARASMNRPRWNAES